MTILILLGGFQKTGELVGNVGRKQIVNVPEIFSTVYGIVKKIRENPFAELQPSLV